MIDVFIILIVVMVSDGGLYNQNSFSFVLEICAVCCMSRMLPWHCLRERLVLEVYLCDQKLGHIFLSSLRGAPLGVKRGRENTYLTKCFKLWAQHCLHPWRTQHLVSSVTDLVFLLFPQQNACVLSLSVQPLPSEIKGYVFFWSPKLIWKQGRTHRMSRQPCECLLIAEYSWGLGSPTTKGCKHLNHVAYVWIPTPIFTMIKIIKTK